MRCRDVRAEDDNGKVAVMKLFSCLGQDKLLRRATGRKATVLALVPIG